MSFASCFSSPPLPLFVFKCVFRKSVAKLLTPTYSVSGAIIHGRWCTARRAARGGRESLGRTPTTQTKVTWTSIDDSDFCLPVSRVSFPTMWGHAVRAGMPVAGGAAPGLLASRDRYFCNVNVRILQANAASGRHVHGKNPMPTLGCRVCWLFFVFAWLAQRARLCSSVSATICSCQLASCLALTMDPGSRHNP